MSYHARTWTLMGFFMSLALSTGVPLKTDTSMHHGNRPTRIIAGIEVIDTPIVRAAQSLARQHSSDIVYKHVMRSWLFGSALIALNSTLQTGVDLEVHALAALLHDLGWDRTPNSPFVSKDRPFEVDGAIAAKDFIEKFGDKKEWTPRRNQLVWDAIALHSQQRIFQYKELEVKAVGDGISVEFSGLASGISKRDYDAIVAEFDDSNFVKDGLAETLIWLCHTKPEATYDTPLQPFGETFVPGYSAKGHRIFDAVFPDYAE